MPCCRKCCLATAITPKGLPRSATCGWPWSARTPPLVAFRARSRHRWTLRRRLVRSRRRGGSAGGRSARRPMLRGRGLAQTRFLGSALQPRRHRGKADSSSIRPSPGCAARSRPSPTTSRRTSTCRPFCSGRDVDEALAHRELAYRRQCVFVQDVAHRAAHRPHPAGCRAGQPQSQSSVFPTHNNTVDWIIEYAPNGQAATLPPFDLVFNAMGDPDMAGAATLPASRFIAGCDKPVLNRPDVVARTSREKQPALLEGIGGLFVPEVWRVSPEAAWPLETRDGLPVLVRPVESHGGEGLQRIASASSWTALPRSSARRSTSRASATSAPTTAGTENIGSSSSTGSRFPITSRFQRTGSFTTPRPIWSRILGSSRRSVAFWNARETRSARPGWRRSRRSARG